MHCAIRSQGTGVTCSDRNPGNEIEPLNENRRTLVCSLPAGPVPKLPVSIEPPARHAPHACGHARMIACRHAIEIIAACWSHWCAAVVERSVAELAKGVGPPAFRRTGANQYTFVCNSRR